MMSRKQSTRAMGARRMTPAPEKQKSIHTRPRKTPAETHDQTEALPARPKGRTGAVTSVFRSPRPR